MIEDILRNPKSNERSKQKSSLRAGLLVPCMMLKIATIIISNSSVTKCSPVRFIKSRSEIARSRESTITLITWNTRVSEVTRFGIRTYRDRDARRDGPTVNLISYVIYHGVTTIPPPPDLTDDHNEILCLFHVQGVAPGGTSAKRRRRRRRRKGRKPGERAVPADRRVQPAEQRRYRDTRRDTGRMLRRGEWHGETLPGWSVKIVTSPRL